MKTKYNKQIEHFDEQNKQLKNEIVELEQQLDDADLNYERERAKNIQISEQLDSL